MNNQNMNQNMNQNLNQTDFIYNLINNINNEMINNLNVTIENGDNLVNQLFNNQVVHMKPTDEKFIDELKKIKIDENFLKENNYCSICMDSFQLNDTCIELPCKDKPHYFHVGDNKEICQGILPWLENNNNCPICRTEFPINKQEAEINNEQEPEINNGQEPEINNEQGPEINNGQEIDSILDNIINIVNNEINVIRDIPNIPNNHDNINNINNMFNLLIPRIIQIPINDHNLINEEERQLQRAIELSLNVD